MRKREIQNQLGQLKRGEPVTNLVEKIDNMIKKEFRKQLLEAKEDKKTKEKERYKTIATAFTDLPKTEWTEFGGWVKKAWKEDFQDVADEDVVQTILDNPDSSTFIRKGLDTLVGGNAASYEPMVADSIRKMINMFHDWREGSFYRSKLDVMKGSEFRANMRAIEKGLDTGELHTGNDIENTSGKYSTGEVEFKKIADELGTTAQTASDIEVKALEMVKKVFGQDPRTRTGQEINMEDMEDDLEDAMMESAGIFTKLLATAGKVALAAPVEQREEMLVNKILDILGKANIISAADEEQITDLELGVLNQLAEHAQTDEGKVRRMIMKDFLEDDPVLTTFKNLVALVFRKHVIRGGGWSKTMQQSADQAMQTFNEPEAPPKEKKERKARNMTFTKRK